MFQLNNKIDSPLPIITANYKELLYDEDPILFLGTNKYGNKIIGSLIEEDEQTYDKYYFHLLVDNTTYFEYIERKKTYREIILNSEDLYVVKRDITNNIKEIYFHKKNDIPLDYLPYENTLCPVLEKEFSENFCVTLEGGKADKNIGVSTDTRREFKSYANRAGKLIRKLQNFNS